MSSDAAIGLDRVLGDGFLCAKNRLYRVARENAVAAGYRFEGGRNDAYMALPLSQLDELLVSRAIPYLDNVTVLESLEKRAPRATEWNDIVDNLKGNSVFHEACHAVAHARLEGVEPGLRMMLEESYANACELLSVLDAEDQVHRIFLELNSYVYMLPDRVHLARAEKDVGLPSLLRFMLLAYLHANYLRESFEFERMLKLAVDGPVAPPVQKNLRQLAKIALQLNPRFREVTTQFYFKLHGLKLDLGRDFLGAVEESSKIRAFLASL